MALISCNEIFDGNEASLEAKGFLRTYVRKFRVIANSLVDGPLEIILAGQLFANLPLMYSFFQFPNGDFDTGARMISYRPRREGDNPFCWVIECQYSSQIDEVARKNEPEMARDSTQAGNQQFNDPFAQPASIKWGTAKYQKPVWQDLNGKAVVNSAGTRFDPLLEIDDGRPVLTIVRNELFFDPSVAVLYQDAVNADAFFNAAPAQAKMDSIERESAFENGIYYSKVTYVIHFRREGWQPAVLDQGLQVIDVITNKLKAALDPVTGTPVTAPILLDGAGHALAGPPNTPAKFVNFTTYKSLPFGALLLPFNLPQH